MLNQVHLIGRVGTVESVTKGTPSKRITKFSIATSAGSKEFKKTTWHNCVAFGKTQEIIEKLVKIGDLLFVDGSISSNTVEKDGKKTTYHSIVVNKFDLLSRKSDTPNELAPDADVLMSFNEKAAHATNNVLDLTKNPFATQATKSEPKAAPLAVAKDENTSFFDDIPF